LAVEKKKDLIKIDLKFFVLSLKNVTIVKPIVYGNTARYFGKKRDEDGHTHGWSFYVKAYENEVPKIDTFYYQKVHYFK
jgi:YEATS domain-containing protein 4